MFSMLQYDIPTHAKIANPSRRLSRVAIRTTLSVWIVRNDNLPHRIIADLEAAGCAVRVLPFDPAAAERCLAAAAADLRREVEKITAACEKSIAAADAALACDDITTKQHAARVRAAIRRNQKALENIQNAEAMFGIDAGVQSGLAALAGFHAAVLARGAAVLAAADKMEESGEQGLAEAARDGDVPDGIVGDWMEDNGQDRGELSHSCNQTDEDVQRVIAESQSRWDERQAVMKAAEKARNDYPEHKNEYIHGTPCWLAYDEAWDALHEQTEAELLV